ncbi:MAG: amidohydrolase family protein [Chloroflexi bacterium]|nr:amidohydrolase family protein [Chloroflexota bacterium]
MDLTGSCPAIDAHVHFHPDVSELVARVMDENNLEGVVNLGALERLGIPFAEGLRTMRAALGERVVVFATPDFSDVAPGFGQRMADDLDRKVGQGAGGLKIFKELGLRYSDAEGRLIAIDDPRLDPLWAKAGLLGIPVLIHTADPVAFFQPLTPDNERWDELYLHPDWHFGRPEFPGHDSLLDQRNRVIEAHPEVMFIGAHLGNYPENLGYVDQCLGRYPNFYVDLSARIGEIGRHPVAETRAFFLKHQDRILFGTDWVLGWGNFVPGDDAFVDGLPAFRTRYAAYRRFLETDERQIEHPGYPVQGRWKVDAIGLTDEVLSKIYRGNARRLIPTLGHAGV